MNQYNLRGDISLVSANLIDTSDENFSLLRSELLDLADRYNDKLIIDYWWQGTKNLNSANKWKEILISCMETKSLDDLGGALKNLSAAGDKTTWSKVIFQFKQNDQLARVLELGDLCLAEDINCIVCEKNTRSIVFLPCTHLACCEQCSKLYVKCRICRERIEESYSVKLK